jgi:hypothetical protein
LCLAIILKKSQISSWVLNFSAQFSSFVSVWGFQEEKYDKMLSDNFMLSVDNLLSEYDKKSNNMLSLNNKLSADLRMSSDNILSYFFHLKTTHTPLLSFVYCPSY